MSDHDSPQTELNALTELVQGKTRRVRLVASIIAGLLAAAMAAAHVFLIFTVQNQSDILARRSPVLEHVLCYEERSSHFFIAQTNLVQALLDDDRDPATPTAEAVVLARRQMDVSANRLIAALDLNNPDACPANPLPK